MKLATIITAASLAATSAQAIELKAGDCFDSAKTMFTVIYEEYGERLALVGMRTDGSEDTPETVMSFFIHKETRTWTMVDHWPGGQVCVVAFGRDLEFSNEN